MKFITFDYSHARNLSNFSRSRGALEGSVRTGLKGQGSCRGSGLCGNRSTNACERGRTPPIIQTSCFHVAAAVVQPSTHVTTTGPAGSSSIRKKITRFARVRGTRAHPVRASAPQSGDDRRPNLAAALR